MPLTLTQFTAWVVAYHKQALTIYSCSYREFICLSVTQMFINDEAAISFYAEVCLRMWELMKRNHVFRV